MCRVPVGGDGLTNSLFKVALPWWRSALVNLFNLCLYWNDVPTGVTYLGQSFFPLGPVLLRPVLLRPVLLRPSPTQADLFFYLGQSYLGQAYSGQPLFRPSTI